MGQSLSGKYKYMFQFGHGTKAFELLGPSIGYFWNDIYDVFDIEREMMVEKLDGASFSVREIKKLFRDLAEDMEEDFAEIWLEIQDGGKRLLFVESNILPGLSLDEEEDLFIEYLVPLGKSQVLLSTNEYRAVHFPEEKTVTLLVDADEITIALIKLFLDKVRECNPKKLFLVNWRDIAADVTSFLVASKVILLNSQKMLREINSRNLETALVPFLMEVQNRSADDFTKDRFRVYLDLVKSARSNVTKKESLENLSKYFLNGVAGLKVIEKNRRGPSEELDLVIANESSDPPLKTIGNPIAVECRHRRKPASSKDIRDFCGKLTSVGLRAGILISLKGVTGDIYDAVGVIRDARKNGVSIIVINLEDLSQIVKGKKPLEVIRDCFYKYV